LFFSKKPERPTKGVIFFILPFLNTNSIFSGENYFLQDPKETKREREREREGGENERERERERRG